MMTASKFPDLKLYHIKTQPTMSLSYTVKKVCSYSPITIIQHGFRQQEYAGTIKNWQIYQIDPALAKNTKIDTTWDFMDERGNLDTIEILYIRLLAGI